jgi:hypothetical protein
VVLLGRLVPGDRLRVILVDAPALLVHQGEVILGVGVALLGRLAVPGDRLRVILVDAPALLVHQGEVILGVGVALLGRLAVPGDRLRVILGDAPVAFIHFTDDVLSRVMQGDADEADDSDCTQQQAA